MEEPTIQLLIAIGCLIIYYIIDKFQTNNQIKMLENELKLEKERKERQF